jgi:hypothetical protein
MSHLIFWQDIGHCQPSTKYLELLHHPPHAVLFTKPSNYCWGRLPGDAGADDTAA